MLTLTETARISRKIIKYSLISLVALLILIPTVKASIRYWDKLHPAPPPPPDVAFGKLPPIKFGKNYQVIPNHLQFQLQTIEGTLPNLGDRAKVYFIPTLGSKFFDEEKTRRRANALGFPREVSKLNPTEFLFINPHTEAELRIDTVNNNFQIDFPYREDHSFTNFPAPNHAQALNTIKNLLTRAELWPDDVDTNKTKFTFLRYQPAEGKFITVPSLSEAQVVKINIFRANRHKLPILPSHPQEANISFIVSQDNKLEKRVIKGRYIHYAISYDQSGTYPLKTPNVAWEELKAGKAYIANLGNNSEKKPIIVRRVHLAYFDPDIAQNFLQPIFVFEGDNGFLAYLPAVDSAWVKG